jgi:hypothetical protein
VELELAPQHPADLLTLPQPHHELEFNKAVTRYYDIVAAYLQYSICIIYNFILAQVYL